MIAPSKEQAAAVVKNYGQVVKEGKLPVHPGVRERIDAAKAHNSLKWVWPVTGQSGRRSAMMLSRRAVFGLPSCLSIAGCQRRQPEEIRYRLPLDVDTPEGVKTGSSVWRQRVIWDDGLSPA